MNYKGQFRSLDDTLYQVRIYEDMMNLTLHELPMAGEELVVIDYDIQENLFSPLKPSTVTIKFLTDGYPLDLYTTSLDSYVFIEKVSETQGGKDELIWFGFLQPNVYSQGYSEPTEELELVAWDAISALQLRKYTTEGDRKKIVSFKSILQRICDMSYTDGFAVCTRKLLDDGNMRQIDMKEIDRLLISEQNFFSSENEPWNMRDVLEEICKYTGMTAVIWKNILYLVDPLSYHDSGLSKSIVYLKSNNYVPAAIKDIGGLKSIDRENYRQTGGELSLDNIINHVTVKDNYYNTDRVFPDIFEEDDLENTNGNWDAYKIAVNDPGDAKPDGMTNIGMGNQIYYRIFRNKKWNYQFYDINDSKIPVTPQLSSWKDFNIQRRYCGATILDTAAFENIGTDEESDLDFKRYLCLAKHNKINDKNSTEFWPLLTAGDIPPVFVGEDTYMVISTDAQVSFVRYTPALPTCLQLSFNETKRKFGVYGEPLPEFKLNFKLRIGGKWWNGDRWIETSTTFSVPMERLEKDTFFQHSVSGKDTTDKPLFLGIKGYQIPMPTELGTSDEIEFSICMPSMWLECNLYTDHGQPDGEPIGNEYVWLSNFSVDIRKKNHTIFKDEDVIVENEIVENNSAISDNDAEIELKITTEGEQFSYSTVAVRSWSGSIVPLKGINEPKFGEAYQTAEENIVQSYIEQYKTPTIRETVTVDKNFVPIGLIEDRYWNGRKFFCIGQKINLAMDRQDITLLERKK